MSLSVAVPRPISPAYRQRGSGPHRLMDGMCGPKGYRECIVPSSSTNQTRAISAYEGRSRRWGWVGMPFTLFPRPLPFRWMWIGCVSKYWRIGRQGYGLFVLQRPPEPWRPERLIHLMTLLICATSKGSGCTLMEPMALSASWMSTLRLFTRA